MSMTIKHSDAFKFITEQKVRELAPSAFTEEIAKRISHRYIHISTPQVLKDLISESWKPIHAYEVRPKKSSNKGFQKHFITLRNPNVYIGSKDQIECIPELLLVNSYDARCAFKFILSLWRPPSNSSVIVNSSVVTGSDKLDELHVHHKGWKHEEMPQVRASIDKNIKAAVEWRSRLQKAILTQQQQKDFAREACQARWDYKYTLSPKLDPKQLLYALRQEDEGDDLWTVFNRVQEKLSRGGWIGREGRSIKPLVDPNRNLIVNTKLSKIVDNFHYQLRKNQH